MNVEPEYFECIIKHGQYAYRNILKFAKDNKTTTFTPADKVPGKPENYLALQFPSLSPSLMFLLLRFPKTIDDKTISKIRYASDLSHLSDELVRVTNFASPLKADVEVLHFKVPIDYLMDNKEMKNIREKLLEHKIYPRFETMDYKKTLIRNITKVLKRSKPSLLIMFTRQKRSLFEKLFISSVSAENAFITQTPLLIFNK